MAFSNLALNPEWVDLWASPQVSGKREELSRLLRSPQARDPYVLGRLQGYLDALDWLERLPAREQGIRQKKQSLSESL